MLSFPLAKLSVAQDTDHSETKFFWHHEIQQIFLILDDYGTNPSSQLLKLVQGVQARQTIELERLINQAHQLMKEMENRGVKLHINQLPISAIVRCPLLAIRWQLPNNKTRRVQLKFKSNNDYDTVYGRLDQLGLYMSKSVPKDGLIEMQRPNSSVERTSIQLAKPSLQAAAYPQLPASGGLSCPPSRLAEITNRPFTALNAPTSLESRIQEAAHARPASALAGEFHQESSRKELWDNSLSQQLVGPRHISTASHTAIPNEVFPPRNLMPTGREISNEPGERPESAMLYNRPDSAESLLPPRRELPFQRSSGTLSSGCDSIRPSSRPSTGLMGPPPLPARVASLRPPSSQGSTQVVNVPPLPQPTIINQPFSPVALSQQPPRTPNQDYNISVPALSSPYEEGEKQRSLGQALTSSPLSLNRASSTTTSTMRPFSPFGSAIQTSSPTIPQNPPAVSANLASPFANLDVLRPTPKFDASSANALRTYAMQPEDERRAALNEFIFRNLENDDFLALVEDMETCWARAALGMK